MAVYAKHVAMEFKINTRVAFCLHSPPWRLFELLEAMDCYDHALPILECSLDGGKMHPFVGTTLLNDALCRIDRARKGDIDVAISKIARVIGIFGKYYGLDSTRAQEAIELLQRAKTCRANL